MFEFGKCPRLGSERAPTERFGFGGRPPHWEDAQPPARPARLWRTPLATFLWGGLKKSFLKGWNLASGVR